MGRHGVDRGSDPLWTHWGSPPGPQGSLDGLLWSRGPWAWGLLGVSRGVVSNGRQGTNAAHSSGHQPAVRKMAWMNDGSILRGGGPPEHLAEVKSNENERALTVPDYGERTSNTIELQ